ncbi:alanine dehydrogenase [Xylocopilactobacillus apicola]|uniref:Alanine dehydrogenase n=1 Tax=Xylocopilactobacillus apicola TaxID=2932184 RepID=A0AAU9DR54_9LACO|nr:alanine dehydrogenase [Xylocopilactobacillus apicola]BDR58399.1 alanine dehydrogenase [Xylocopilactobacillus apicola]
MLIGIPKEIKVEEHRVGMTPSGVHDLVNANHQVIVEKDAGFYSGYLDKEYIQAGATIGTAEDAWDTEMVIKVKEPLASEYHYFKAGQIIYTYLHLAANRELVDSLIKSQVTGVAYETMEDRHGHLPLLFPMSEIAGRMAVQVGSHFLEQTFKGKGIILSGVTGVQRGNVVIIGAGTVGFNAAKIAVGMGANVTILDINADRLAEVDNLFDGKIQTLMSNPHNIAQAVKSADLVIGAVLIPGAVAPKLVTEEMIANMEKGSVVVDIPIDQGGIFETSVRATTHDDPVFISHGVIHYAVANIPGAVPRVATDALSSATLPYALQIASKGIKKAAADNPMILKGINTFEGKLTEKSVADSLDLECTKFV